MIFENLCKVVAWSQGVDAWLTVSKLLNRFAPLKSVFQVPGKVVGFRVQGRLGT